MMNASCLSKSFVGLLDGLHVLRIWAPIVAVPTIRASIENRGGGDDEISVPPGPPEGALEGAGPAGQDRLVVQEPPQVGGQLLGRRVAARRVLGDRLQDDRFQVARDRRVEPARRDRLVERDLAEQLLMVAAVEGGLRASRARRASRPGRRCRSAGRRRRRRARACSGLM